MKNVHPSRTLYAALIAVALFGAGCLIQNRPVTPPQPNPTPTSTSDTATTTALLDTTGWKEYRDNASGMSFKYPSSWVQDETTKKPEPLSENPFWIDGNLGYVHIAEYPQTGEYVFLEIYAKKSALSLQDVWHIEGLDVNHDIVENFYLNGFPAIRNYSEISLLPKPLIDQSTKKSLHQYFYNEQIIVQGNGISYYMVVQQSSPDKANADIRHAEWKTLLSTFHLFEPTK